MTTKGSRQYWPKRRASRRLPRVRSIPTHKGDARLSNVVAYKMGMISTMLVDDSESPSKQQEVSRACTVLEVPQTFVIGIRLYRRNSLSSYPEVQEEIYSRELSQKIGMKAHNDESSLASLKEKIKGCSDVSALLVAFPKSISNGQNHAERFESRIDAKTIEEKFEFASANLGKEIKADSVFKNGEYIDVTSITKGKGWQGIIKRYGVARLSHKATQKVRHIGTHGDYGLGRVMYTVPQPGQMGFNYRTERNKRIILIGGKDRIGEINKSSGYRNYGNAKNAFVVVDGSIPGPSRRLVRLRESLSNLNEKGVKEPKILQISK